MKDSCDKEGNVRSLMLRMVQCNRVQLFQTNSKVCPGVKELLVGQLYFMVFENIFWAQLQEEKLRLKNTGEIEPEPETHFSADIDDDELQQRAEQVSSGQHAAAALVAVVSVPICRVM